MPVITKRKVFLDYSKLDLIITEMENAFSKIDCEGHGLPLIYLNPKSNTYTLWVGMEDATESRFSTQKLGSIYFNNDAKAAFLRIKKPNPDKHKKTFQPLEAVIGGDSIESVLKSVVEKYAYK